MPLLYSVSVGRLRTETEIILSCACCWDSHIAGARGSGLSGVFYIVMWTWESTLVQWLLEKQLRLYFKMLCEMARVRRIQKALLLLRLNWPGCLAQPSGKTRQMLNFNSPVGSLTILWKWKFSKILFMKMFTSWLILPSFVRVWVFILFLFLVFWNSVSCSKGYQESTLKLRLALNFWYYYYLTSGITDKHIGFSGFLKDVFCCFLVLGFCLFLCFSSFFFLSGYLGVISEEFSKPTDALQTLNPAFYLRVFSDDLKIKSEDLDYSH